MSGRCSLESTHASLPSGERCKACNLPAMADMLAAFGIYTPKPDECLCWHCLKGKNVAMMILCPECGNKRCPKASDHNNACSGSNEPGQPGSVY